MTKHEKFPKVGPEAFTAVKSPQTAAAAGGATPRAIDLVI